jgi:ACT domain-containing protein
LRKNRPDAFSTYTMKGSLMKCVISVLGKDRSGVVAAVSKALAENGANIDDINQTILNNQIFSMTMLVTLDPEVADFNTVQESLSAVGEEIGMQVIMQREDVFQYMYKV